MDQALTPLTTFKDQFTFAPSITNEGVLVECPYTIIAGMGGSAICVSLLKMLFPELSITLHNSYGLPASFNKETTLLILNSYSGDTEEILDGLDRSVKEGAHVALLSRGGKLIQRGKELGAPYIELPESNLEPRFSIGHQLIGLLTLMGQTDKIRILKEKMELVSSEKAQESGKAWAEALEGKYPVLYASSSFYPVAYLIKAAINEGAKIPSFVNTVPEANHNELQSFVTDDTTNEKDTFAFLFLSSNFDHQRITKRFSVMKELYEKRGFTVIHTTKDATNITEIFDVILSGYYAATYLALAKNIDPYKTPLVKEFKEAMAQ